MSDFWKATFLDLDRHLDETFEKLIYRRWAIPNPAEWRPPFDLHESAQGYVVEIDLPGNDGPELLSWMAENRPELARRTLIVTSADSEPNYAEFLRDHRCPILHKPVRGESLLAAVAAMLGEERAL